jgi:hypothetical protein
MSNIGYTPGTGAFVRTDLVGGDLVQWIKMTVGAADTATPLQFGQALASASLPVVLASDQGALAVTVSGVSTAANQTIANASLASIDGKTATLVGGRVPVDGSAVTQPVSAAALPLPAGASTAANQTTANASLASIDGKLGSLGQKLMAGSAPIVIASDQSAVPISAASLPLPSGAATSALQSTGNSSLATIATNTTGAALDSTLTGGNARARITDGTNVATVKAASTAAAAADTALVVSFAGANTATKIGDGTNNAAIKAASTAAAATDPSLTVALSPNSPLPAGTNNIGTTTLLPSATVGGANAVHSSLSLATTAATQIKGSVGNLFSISLRNNSAGTRWVKLFNLASASVTMGTSTPVLNIGIGAGASRDITFPQGLRPAGGGLSYSVTSGQAILDNTSTGLAAGDVEVNVAYI